MESALVSLENDVDFAVGVGAVRDLLSRNGIEPSEVGKLHRIKDVKVYQGLTKDEDGNATVSDMVSVVLHPMWENGPQWDLLVPGPSVPKLKRPKAKSKKKGGHRKALILPDMQIGFYRGEDGEMISTHDETAMELALKVAENTQPDIVVMVGDNLDLPEFGKYRTSPAFVLTTQASINAATIYMWRLRLACPNAEIIWLAGNHEERLPNYILDNASAAFALKQGVHPLVNIEEPRFPVLSVPHLCRLDLSDVTYLPGYPANDYWLNERLKIIHGNRVKSNGSTAHVYLGQEKESIIYGHIHRREYACRSFDTYKGGREIMAATPGTLAKVNGEVPSTKGAHDLDGRPLTVVEDWQQGIAVVDYETNGSHWFTYENIPIVMGRCKAEGQFFSV